MKKIAHWMNPFLTRLFGKSLNSISHLSKCLCRQGQILNYVVAWLLIPLFTETASTQGCGSIVFSVQNTSQCCYNLTAQNMTDNCFQQLNLSFADGVFTSYTPAAGWQAVQVGPKEFNVRPAVGFIPFGNVNIGNFCVSGVLNQNLTILWDNLCSLEGCVAELPVTACTPDNVIRGVKYVDIGCAGKPYTDQPVLADWPIELLDNFGQIIANTQTDDQGNFSFSDLAPGKYTCREGIQSGWKSSAPKNGQHSVTLSGTKDTVIVNFGNCPTTCSCDSISIYTTLLSVNEDTGNYRLNLVNINSYCFEYIELKVNSGQEISNVKVDSGWRLLFIEKDSIRIEPIASNKQKLWHTANFRFSVYGGSQHQLTYSTSYSNGNNEVICKNSETFSIPDEDLDCCPLPNLLGPELVVDGDFNIAGVNRPNITLPAYTNYPYSPQTNVFRSYDINDGSSTSTGVPFPFVCMDKSLNPADWFMSVYTDLPFPASTLPQRIWSQPVTVSPGLNYRFSIQLNNAYPPPASWAERPDPGVELLIIDPTTTIPTIVASMGWVIRESPDRWLLKSICWKADTNSVGATNFELAIRSYAGSSAVGTILALDCISFRECTPKPCTCPKLPHHITLTQTHPTTGSQSTHQLNAQNCNSAALFPTLISCPPNQNISIGGLFQCIDPATNQACAVQPTVVTYSLYKSPNYVLPIATGNTTTSLSISFPTITFMNNSLYKLQLSMICGTDTCCFDYYFSIDCDPCICKPNPFTNLSISHANNNGTTTNYLGVNCVRTYTLPDIQSILGPIKINGNLNCSPTWCDKSLTYTFKYNSSPIITNVPVTLNTQGNFIINIQTSLFTNPGIYTVELNGQCDQTLCRPCPITFIVKDCSCDSLQSQINQGFQILHSNCSLKLKPIAWCPGDQFIWTLSRPGYSMSYPTNNGSIVTIPVPTFNVNYTISMSVIRVVNGVPCTRPIPYYITRRINCFRSLLCDSNSVQNGDFSEGNLIGELGSDGKIDNWNLMPPEDDGEVYVIDNKSDFENAHLVLIGNKDNPAGVWQKLDLNPKNFINVGFDLIHYSNENYPVGTEIVVNLQTDSSKVPTGAVKLVERRIYDIANDTLDLHNHYSLPYIHSDDFKYLAIYIRNQNDTAMSVIGIDNIEVCTSEEPLGTYSLKFQQLNVYPNPTKEKIVIQLHNPAQQRLQFKLSDLTGRTVLNQEAFVGSVIQNLDVSKLTPGMYILEAVSNGKRIGVQRVIKE